MKRYLNHIQSKPPHERRQHAVQIASVFTAFVFVAWVATLGMRLATSEGTVANSADQTQLAGVAAYGAQENTLEVATSTSGYSLPYAQ